MPNLAYLLSPKISDRYVMTGAPTLSGGDISNLQNPRPRSRAVFLSSYAYIEQDLGAPFPMDSISIAFINSIASTDVFQWRAGLVYPATTTPLIDSGVQTIWPAGSDLSAFAEVHRQYEHPTTQSVRYLRVDISCSQAIQMGRLFWGKRVEPLNSVSAWSLDATEPIAATVDLGGEETRRPMGGARRSVHMEWPGLTKPEALGPIYELLLERGSSRDYMAAMTGGGQEVVSPMAYVYVGCGQIKTVQNTFTHIWSASLDMVEMAPLRMR